MTPKKILKEIEAELAKIEDEAKELLNGKRETPMEECGKLFQYWIWLHLIRNNDKVDKGPILIPVG